MTGKLTFLTFVLATCLTSYGQSKTISSPDTAVIAILPYDASQYWVFKECKPADLTNNDLKQIETILNECIKDYNPEREIQFQEINDKHPELKLDKKNFVIDLTLYKRQYVAVLNSKGEKEVWVNCFCSNGNENWKENLVFVKDGGNCYFNLKINLTTGKYCELIVNGNP